MYSNNIDHGRISPPILRKKQKCLRIDTHKETGLQNKNTYETSVRHATS